MRRFFIMTATALVLTASVAVVGSGTAHAVVTTCPLDPSPGSTINGSLDVTGTCHLDHVTVQGSVTVEPGAELQMTNSKVGGNLVDNAGDELDLGHSLGGSTKTYEPNIIAGSVTMTNPGDFDLDGATIGGSVTATGGDAFPTICKTSIGGNLTLSNLDDVNIGGDSNCLNPVKIAGSVKITDVGGSEMEFAQVGNSVTVDNSAFGFEGNTVKGSLRCTNGGTLHDQNDGDGTSAPNTVSGSNTCPAPS